MGIPEFSRIDFIVLRYRSMHAVSNRLRFARQMCDPQRTTFAFDMRLGRVNNLLYRSLRYLCRMLRGARVRSRGKHLQLPFHRNRRRQIAFGLVVRLIPRFPIIREGLPVLSKR